MPSLSFGGKERAALAALATLLFQFWDKAQRSLLPRAVALAIGTLSSLLTRKVRNKFEIENWKRRVYLNRLQVVLMSVDAFAMLESGTLADPRVEKRVLFEGSLLVSAELMASSFQNLKSTS